MAKKLPFSCRGTRPAGAGLKQPRLRKVNFFAISMCYKYFLFLTALFFIQSASFSFPVKLKDEFGRSVFIPREPKRIISTMPSNTEILFALGLGKKIIADTTQCNYPPEAKNNEKIGSINLNIEKIVSLNPDLIVMLGDAQKREIAKLSSLNLPVFVVNPHSLRDVIKSIILLGDATGASINANKLKSEIENKIISISAKQQFKKLPKVLVVLWPSPLTTAGKGTFIDNLITLAGGKNIAGDLIGSYPLIGIEPLLKDEPDYIIVPGYSPSDIERVKNDPHLKLLHAVKNNKILFIDSDIITRPSPRLVNGLEIIANYLNKNELK